jgi:hypothetical protein
MPALARRSRWLVVAALLGLAALVRVSAMFYESISGDDATVALMAKHPERRELSGVLLPPGVHRLPQRITSLCVRPHV